MSHRPQNHSWSVENHSFKCSAYLRARKLHVTLHECGVASEHGPISQLQLKSIKCNMKVSCSQICVALEAMVLKTPWVHSEAHFRVGAHSSKPWPCIGNWSKSRGWALFCETMVQVFKAYNYSFFHVSCVTIETSEWVAVLLFWPSLPCRCATVEEVASIVKFIVSKEASFNTAYCLDLTGGTATY